MSDNVVPFGGLTTVEMPPEKVLMAAVGEVNPVVVVGLDTSGNLYVAGSSGDSDLAIALLARAQAWLCAQANEA